MIPEAQDLTCRLVSCLFLCVVHMLVEVGLYGTKARWGGVETGGGGGLCK